MIKTKIDTSGQHLLSLLEQLNLHTEDFADIAGVHRATAFRWIGNQTPTPVSVIRMLELMVEKKGRAT